MSNKRQRTTAGILHITDLPDGIYVGIASYLVKPSVALFAIAMTADSADQHTESSKAIISSIDWRVLDFSDIEKSLAEQLLDDDIDKILNIISAVNNLEILKLAGCVNITGSGLNVLRSASAIEQIDMSLVGKHESPILEPEPLLSEDVVIPILDDIISRRGSRLKQLEFPKKWRKWRNMTNLTQLNDFLERYNNHLIQQRYCCFECHELCVEEEGEEWICLLEGSDWHGTQNYTCSGCLNHFCGRLGCTVANGNSTVNWCKECEKGYCKSCTATYSCRRCELEFCNDCKDMKTCEGECETTFCDDCFEKNTCSFCGKCHACSDQGSLIRCISDHCNKRTCYDCDQSRRGGKRTWDEESKCKCGARLEEYGYL